MSYNPVSMYLMAAYAYYVEDMPIMTDHDFDLLARYIYDHYDEIDHQHKHLITKSDLKAGTYLGKYPLIVQGALKEYRNHAHKKPVQNALRAR